MTTPLNGIKANWFHDEGAIAQCGRCRRYTLDHSALSDRQPTCTCGEKHYWSGSFTKPGPDAQWHGAAPTVFDDLAARLEAVIDATQATLNAERLVRYCPGCGSIGPVESEYLDCCPDGYEARMIPEALAQKCHDTFRLAVDGAVHAEIAGHEAANLHLSAMVDELRELLQDAKRAMTELHQAAIPDESTEGVPAIIPPEAFRKFVDAHAQLCFLMHQRGHNPAQEART